MYLAIGTLDRKVVVISMETPTLAQSDVMSGILHTRPPTKGRLGGMTVPGGWHNAQLGIHS